MTYPWRIRLWYAVHDRALVLAQWVHRTRIAPYHAAHRALPPSYQVIAEVAATEDGRVVEAAPGLFVHSPTIDSGVTSIKVYRS